LRTRASSVAPVDEQGGSARPAKRPPLESPAEVDAILASCRTRSPRLPLADEAAARAALGDATPDGPLPGWMRLLATFPKAGVQRVRMHLGAASDGTLPPRHKAIVAYVAARHDRAWYALDLARRELEAQGFDEAAFSALDDLSAPLADDEVRSRSKDLPFGEAEKGQPLTDRIVASFARKLTVDPALVDDADVERLRAYFDDRQTAELIFHVTEAAFFDRVTEAAALPLEP
jgi:hypothetical protein